MSLKLSLLAVATRGALKLTVFAVRYRRAPGSGTCGSGGPPDCDHSKVLSATGPPSLSLPDRVTSAPERTVSVMGLAPAAEVALWPMGVMTTVGAGPVLSLPPWLFPTRVPQPAVASAASPITTISRRMDIVRTPTECHQRRCDPCSSCSRVRVRTA